MSQNSLSQNLIQNQAEVSKQSFGQKILNCFCFCFVTSTNLPVLDSNQNENQQQQQQQQFFENQNNSQIGNDINIESPDQFQQNNQQSISTITSAPMTDNIKPDQMQSKHIIYQNENQISESKCLSTQPKKTVFQNTNTQIDLLVQQLFYNQPSQLNPNNQNVTCERQQKCVDQFNQQLKEQCLLDDQNNSEIIQYHNDQCFYHTNDIYKRTSRLPSYQEGLYRPSLNHPMSQNFIQDKRDSQTTAEAVTDQYEYDPKYENQGKEGTASYLN
ncbi:hypothetical protein ABPG74_011146 [Tetrahymena malaccensis]